MSNTPQQKTENSSKLSQDPSLFDRDSVKLSFPVDLSQLFTLTYSFDALKTAFDFIILQHDKHILKAKAISE